MIDRLDQLFEGNSQPGLCELRTSLREVLSRLGAAARLIDQHSLKGRVHRLRFEINGRVRSLVVKRLKPSMARRSQYVTQQWLPDIGLSQSGPPLLGLAAEPSGNWVWHIYQDLGDWKIDANSFDCRRIRTAVELIAKIHTRFATYPLLPYCRLYTGDLGIYFFVSNVRDAINSLEALQPSAVGWTSQHLALRDRLLGRLHRLLGEVPYRAEVMVEFGGPDTLLHGDLWTTNILVFPAMDAPLQARLIDWDHAGIGPFSYDLSTFLFQFPSCYRPWIWDCYRQSVEGVGWRLPDLANLILLCETAECARYANSVIWPAIALLRDRAEWAFAQLAEVERWFEDLRPVLPLEVGEHDEALDC